jgi:hypothetical protein
MPVLLVLFLGGMSVLVTLVVFCGAGGIGPVLLRGEFGLVDGDGCRFGLGFTGGSTGGYTPAE